MAVSATAFHWLDLLEKRFDCALVDLDMLLGGGLLDELHDISGGGGDGGGDECDGFEVSLRAKMEQLGSCWSELCHKAETVFQNHAKLEASLLMAEEQLTASEAARAALQAENTQLLDQLHAVQLQLHTSATDNTSSWQPSSPPPKSPPPLSVSPSIAQHMRQKLDSDMAHSRQAALGRHQLAAENRRLSCQLQLCQRRLVQLQADAVGGRMMVKYLDKELMGRIQQLQMLGRGVDSPQLERIWHQLDAEIRLHRHKMMVTTCRARERSESVESRAADPYSDHEILEVQIERADNEPLGIAITGGETDALPVIVSSVKPGGAVARAGGVRAGDTLLAVNGQQLLQAGHREAVDMLRHVQGTVVLKLSRPSQQFLIDHVSSDLRSFKFFETDAKETDGAVIDAVATNIGAEIAANGAESSSPVSDSNRQQPQISANKQQ